MYPFRAVLRLSVSELSLKTAGESIPPPVIQIVIQNLLPVRVLIAGIVLPRVIDGNTPTFRDWPKNPPIARG